MNKVILTGIVGKDATSAVKNNITIAAFSLATSEMVKKGDNYENQVEWHNIKVFGKLAEKAKDYHKGDYLELSGKIKTNKYQNKEGNNVVIVEIIADSIRRIRKSETSNQSQQTQQPQQQRQQSQQQPQQVNDNLLSDEDFGDLPF